MNRLFRFTVQHDKAWMRFKTNRLLHSEGSQATMYQDLYAQEKSREKLFAQELAERETEDVLDRALLKAKHAKL